MIKARATKLSVFDEPEAGIDLWSFNSLIHVFEDLHEKDRRYDSDYFPSGENP